jgi:transposase
MFSPLDKLLNLPGITVQKWIQTSEGFCLYLARVDAGINCPYCQKKTKELHQVRSFLVRDLPAWGQPVYLKVPRRQFYCRYCQKYITEELDYIDPKRKETRRYQENIYQRVLKSSIVQVSQEENLTYEEVESLFIMLSQSADDKEWANRKRLSLDEISKRKGHKNFITLVSDIDTGNLLEVVDSHKQKEIIETLNQQSIEARMQVEEVSVDMWAGFPKVVEEVFPNAVVVIDRFHVMKLINTRLNKIRRAAGINLKGSRYLLLKNASELSPEEKEKIDQVLSQSACLTVAYELKEEFRKIYETSSTVKSGLRQMKKWLAQAQILYNKVTETIRTHLQGICNYFISHATSGVMEGINNKAKLIIRQGYGFSNFDHLRLRLLASFSD